MRSRWWITGLLLLAGILGVISTYTQLSRTTDEPMHIDSGMEWWQGTYVKDLKHPPLARIMDAAFLYWANAINGNADAPADMSSRDSYMRTLLLTRLGSLPFYVLSCLLVYAWSRRLFDSSAALWSLALYVSLSPVTAHAGLATTDMGYAAMLMWSLMAGIRWIGNPAPGTSVALGVSLGMAVCTKFSALVHWPAAMALILAAIYIDNRCNALPSPICRKHVITGVMYVLPPLLLTLGLLYRFYFADIIEGIREVQIINDHGFSLWLWGPLTWHGVWYFFPVVFFFKTPLAFHAAALLGNGRIIGEMRRGGYVERLFPLLAAAGVLIPSMASAINLGVRHVLPLYPLLAIPAGYGLAELWKGNRWKQGLAVGLMLWQVSDFVRAYPDHIAYYNELAGDHPERISLDSDFDWGQDMLLLDKALQERDIHKIYLCSRSHVSAKIVLHTAVKRCPREVPVGWVAISRAYRLSQANDFAWLGHNEAVDTVGMLFDLYYFPPR